MSGLSAFTPETAEIEIPGGQLTVRGLCVEDLTVLLRTHYSTLSYLFDTYVNEQTGDQLIAVGEHMAETGSLDLGGAQQMIFDVVEMAPRMIAQAIALASDEPELIDRAGKLPVSVQIEAAEKIVVLTLKAEGGLEKLARTATRVAGSLGNLSASRSA